MTAPETISEPVKWAGPAFSKGGLKLKNARVTQCIQFVPNTGELCESALFTTDAKVSRFLHVVNTPSTVDRMFYASVTYSAGKELLYFINYCTATSGTIRAARFRAEAAAAGSSTTECYGVHAQGIAFASLYAGTVNALYAEAIAKGTSTVVTLRGAMICADSENTPTSIGTMYGCHVRAKTSVAPGTEYAGLVVETEKFGSGVAMDAIILVKDTTWTSGSTIATSALEFQCDGDVTNLIESSTNCTNVLLFSSATGKGIASGSLKDSDNADIKCDYRVKIKVSTTTLYLAAYDTVV